MLVLNRNNRKNCCFACKKKSVRWPGIEPGSNAWKASMLTITPPTRVERPNKTYFQLLDCNKFIEFVHCKSRKKDEVLKFHNIKLYRGPTKKMGSFESRSKILHR